MNERSIRADVRNPLAADPELAAIMGALAADHPEAAEALRAALKRMSTMWRQDANHLWDRHKSPMGRYHRDNAFVARHCAVIMKSAAVNARHLRLTVAAAIENRPC